MYDMLDQIISKDMNISIKEDTGNYELFKSQMEDVFDKNNVDDISDINKILLDQMIINIKDKYNQDFQVSTNNEEDIQESFNRLIKERENNIVIEKKTEDNQTNIKDLLQKNENELSTNIQTIIEVEKGQEMISPKEQKIYEEKNVISVNINSSKRVNINSSRYNYTIDLNKEGIDSEKIFEISQLIIPIEDNYLFRIPLLLLNIKEFNLSLYLQQEEIIKNKFNSIAIYKPIEVHTIKSSKFNRITIDIRDITGEEYKFNDILKVNIMEVKDNILIFTCSEINENNYHLKDMIKVINLNTYDMFLLKILSNPIKINAIKDNMLFCKLSGEYEDKSFNNIDMKILNISNQNLLFFNQYS